jgi:hypothetical protein
MKAFIAEYGDERYDIAASKLIVFAVTHGKAKALAAREFECDFTEVDSCKRAPKFDQYAAKGKLTDRDYIKEGWSVGCPVCEAMTDEYTARFADGGDYVTGCEYCEDRQS